MVLIIHLKLVNQNKKYYKFIPTNILDNILVDIGHGTCYQGIFQISIESSLFILRKERKR